MSLGQFKTQDSDFVGKRIADLPTRPQMTAQELKSYFDVIPILVLAYQKLNGLIDYLSEQGADSIGVSIEGSSGETIKEILQDLNTKTLELYTSLGASKIGAVASNGFSGENTQAILTELMELLKEVEGEGRTTETIKGNASALSDLAGDDRTTETVKANADAIANLGGEERTTETVKGNADAIASLEADKAVAGGIATLDASGKLLQTFDASKLASGVFPAWAIPDVAKEIVETVYSIEEMLALDIDDVQDHDTVLLIGSGSETDRWFRVLDSTALGTMSAFREMQAGTAVAEIAKEYDPNAVGTLSIAAKFSDIQGTGRTDETIKGNADDIADLGGTGRTTETVKANADAIVSLESSKADSEDIPTNVSELTNDADYDTATSVNQKIANAGGAIISTTTPAGKANAIWINPTTGVIKYWDGEAWEPTYGVFS